LFSILKIEILILLWAILKILTPILRHVQSSIVCYCLFNVWIAVFRLFLLYVEAWLIQIPIFEVKNHIWALILLKAEIAVICQFLFKVLVSHINFHIKSLYITWFPPCECKALNCMRYGGNGHINILISCKPALEFIQVEAWIHSKEGRKIVQVSSC